MLEAGQSIGQLVVKWVSEEIHGEAWDMFDQFNARAFSFCDCSSFVLARRENVDFVFGFDADFHSMGFDLRPRP